MNKQKRNIKEHIVKIINYIDKLHWRRAIKYASVVVNGEKIRSASSYRLNDWNWITNANWTSMLTYEEIRIA